MTPVTGGLTVKAIYRLEMYIDYCPGMKLSQIKEFFHFRMLCAIWSKLCCLSQRAARTSTHTAIRPCLVLHSQQSFSTHY